MNKDEKKEEANIFKKNIAILQQRKKYFKQKSVKNLIPGCRRFRRLIEQQQRAHRQVHSRWHDEKVEAIV